MFLSRYRKAVDTFLPPLGWSYRVLRDSAGRRRSIETAYGFSLAGDPSMTGEDWEADEIGLFLKLIATHDAVIDIGANVGFYSCLTASRGKPTIAIEPSPRNLKFLNRNISENHFNCIEVMPLGLAGEPGLARMYGYGGIASFVSGWAQARAAHSCVVPVTTLDALAAGRFQGQRLLIKMDVEGFELDVLAGAGKTLDLTPKPTWLVEILLRDPVIPGGINAKFSETFKVFREHGYRCRRLNATATTVDPEEVSRWVAQEFVEDGAHDFLFEAD